MRFVFIFLAFIFLCHISNAQVGVDTSNATTTLFVKSTPNESTKMDGLIPPILSKNQLNNKIYSSIVVANTYNSLHKGTFVYVNDITQPTNAIKPAVTDINDVGLYEFDGTKWNYFLLSSTDFTVY